MINEETKKRIEKEAKSKYPPNEKGTKELTTRLWAEQRGYIAGATAEAERNSGLVTALKNIIIGASVENLGDAGQFIFEMTTIAHEALNQYNNPVK